MTQPHPLMPERAQIAQRKAEHRAHLRGKVLMGSAAIVGLVSVVSCGYSDEVTATCVADNTNVVAPEDHCDSGTPGPGGTFIYAGMPYRYYYGGTSHGVGTVATGGTLQLPNNTVGRTSSGNTVNRNGSITRGGFGSKSGGSSGSSGS